MKFDPEKNLQAVEAMDWIETMELSTDSRELGTQLAPVMDRYGVPPSEQIDVLQRARERLERNPSTDVNEFAREAVGRAVADPRVAGEQAKEAVVEGGQGRSGDALKQHAAEVAGQKTAMTGANSQDAETLAHEYMDQGMSPSAAAQAATLVTVARHMGFPAGLEIFGHLKARVSGLVMETNRGSEDKTVTNETVWQIDQSLVQTSNTSYKITCENYHAKADHDVSTGILSWNFYLGGYQMSSPQPITLTLLSVGAAATTNNAYMTTLQGAGFRYAWPVVGDFYATLLAVAATAKSKGVETKEVSRRLLDIYLCSHYEYSASGNGIGREANSAMETLQKAKSAGKALLVAMAVSGAAAGASVAAAS